MAATGQRSVEAVTSKPSGVRSTLSVWLIQHRLSPQQPEKSALSRALRRTPPYSPMAPAGPTSPPSNTAMSWQP